MTFPRRLLSIAALSTATLVLSACAATGNPRAGKHPTASDATHVAHAAAAKDGATSMHHSAAMPGHAEQMKAMQQMHGKMIATKTPDERTALMADHMKVMQNGMHMMSGMGGMGAGGHSGNKPGDMAARQGMMEQHMDMMQSMMQMMLDRMPAGHGMK